MAKLTDSGKMKNRVEFFEIKKINGEWGIEESPVSVGSFYCELRSQMLHEVRKNVGTLLENTLTIILRHNELLTITSDMRAVVDGVNYEIIQHTKDVTFKQFDTLIVRRRD